MFNKNLLIIIIAISVGHVKPNADQSPFDALLQHYGSLRPKPNNEVYILKPVYINNVDLSLQHPGSEKPQQPPTDPEEPPHEMPEKEPCHWHGNTACTTKYDPICVTNLNCIFIVRNKCELDKLNCHCETYHVLDPKFCNNFTNPLYKRCNIKLYIK